jgi:hypothetical protein
VRPPRRRSYDDLLTEGPDVSLGAALERAIMVRAATTAGGAAAAWLLARASGTRQRASTTGLVALVGTQLGQTLATGLDNPLVVASALGSAAVLAAIVQTPGVSQFFGCTPLDPLAWSIAVGSATAATAATAVVRVVGERSSRSRELSPAGEEPTPDVLGGFGDGLVGRLHTGGA